MQWFLKVVKDYAVFGGRARRKEYWMYTLFYAIGYLILYILESLIGLTQVLTGIYSLALLLPSLGVTIRRLHDTGRSGWWILISLIPLIGAIILLVFLCQDSKGSNQYGPNPKEEEAGALV
ncbi:DUF805 domain-containing protein [Brevibacillus sp. TJ4]|uniref:DUF805 domain-containing protein n=1 Tax=Brevibacillus sp. TJ4 TaxID=3234853 RepID=UPI0037D98EDA